MPSFSLESKTVPNMMYNLKMKGGIELEGSAEIEMVHKEKNQIKYAEYAMERIENS